MNISNFISALNDSDKNLYLYFEKHGYEYNGTRLTDKYNGATLSKSFEPSNTRIWLEIKENKIQRFLIDRPGGYIFYIPGLICYEMDDNSNIILTEQWYCDNIESTS